MKTYDPDEAHAVEDNVEAMRLIVGAGVLDKMKPSGTANTSHYHFQTEHHWCSASHHIGHEKESDNGYTVILLPKSRMSKEEAGWFFATLIAKYHEGPENLHFEFSVIGRKENN